MVEKKVVTIAFGVVLILTLIIALFYTNVIQSTLLQSTFTPIYCNDYEFTCCREKKDFESTITLKLTEAVKCPSNANKCQILSHNSAGGLYVGSQNCRIGKRLIFFDAWICDGEKIVPNAFPLTIKAGEYAYFDRTATLTYNSYSNQLIFCGRSGCDIGVPVSGADGCTFQTNKDIYDPNTGSLLKQSTGTISYTVNNNECVLSYQQGDRHVCGNFEEICSSNADCGGHTYGNMECNARTLQVYGCNKLGNIVPSGVVQVNGEYTHYDTTQSKGDYGNIPSSRCAIQSANQVQCCGDADCGSNALCDNNPSSPTAWTCKAKATVQCQQDSDCGVSTQCNINTKEIQKPYCTALGKCDFKKIDDVQCCSNADCASGSFCDNDKKCKQSSVPKTTCIAECCVGEANYFDKPCPTGSNCQDNKCTTTPPPPPPIKCPRETILFGLANIPKFLDYKWMQCSLENSPLFWVFTIGIGLLTAGLAYLLMRKKFDDNDASTLSVVWIISIILGGLIGLLFYFFALIAIIVVIILGIITLAIRLFLRK